MSDAACTVTRVRLHHFRNYDEVTVRFDAGLNVIAGPNAQGKTNLLEAVATLSLTRSPRAASAADLLQWGTDGCQIEADVSRPTGPATLTARFERIAPDGGVSRHTMLDAKPRGARALLGICPVVLFWPDDLQLVKSGPDGRRRLLDVLLSQLDARAAVHLLRYRRVLEQRNALLHRIRAEGGRPDALQAFTRELAHHGARVAVARRRLVDDLAPLAAEALDELSAGRERLRLAYTASYGDTSDDDAAEAALLRALDARSNDEVARGMTLLGPHRDDMDIVLDGRPARYTASQGQQRSIVLACKIAEMRHVTRAAGMSPVVLLDDVVSELDADRRAHLLRVLAAAPQQQVLLTTTEPASDVTPFTSVRHLTVHAGTVHTAP